MKHEKEGEMTDTADTSKTQRGDTATQAAQRANQQNVLWDYTLGPLPALKCENFHPGFTVCGIFAR